MCVELWYHSCRILELSVRGAGGGAGAAASGMAADGAATAALSNSASHLRSHRFSSREEGSSLAASAKAARAASNWWSAKQAWPARQCAFSVGWSFKDAVASAAASV